MKLRHVRAAGLLLIPGIAGLLTSGCADGPTSPPPLPSVVVETPRQWSGSSVSLRSDAFVAGGDVRVAIGEDTVPTTAAAAPELRSFVLPPLLTGTYPARVLVGMHSVPISIDVLGLAREPVFFAGGCCSSTVHNVQGTGRGSAYFSDFGGDFCHPATRGAYCVVDLFEPGIGTAVSGLFGTDSLRILLDVPGPSYRTNHLVFDLAPVGESTPRVYRLTPSLEPVRELACRGMSGLSRTVAEISPTTCLETVWPGEIWRDGVEMVIRDEFNFEDAQFRIGPGGTRTALVTRRIRQDEAMEMWPVFGADGRILYEVDRYEHVPGAAFSDDGSTIWVAARDRADVWRLDELEAATGEVRRSLVLPEVETLLDVMRDPVDAVLHVASTDALGAPVLHVVDRQRLDLIRSVPAPLGRRRFGIRNGGVLEPGGSDGRVHLLGWLATDAGWTVWSFDRQ